MDTTTLPAPSDLDQRQLLRFVQDMHQLRRQREEAYDRLKHAHQITLSKLALAAEYKDGDTGTHIERIGALSGELARVLGQAADWCELISDAAPMHDIGKIGVPDSILKKPGALTTAERLIMETHPIIGAQILGNTDVPVLKMAAEIALGHHERWDGSGYPNKLQGKAIPLSARIVSIIDFIDALMMDRCYRKALSEAETLTMVKTGRGAHFDPEIVDAAIAHFPRLVALRKKIDEQKASERVDSSAMLHAVAH